MFCRYSKSMNSAKKIILVLILSIISFSLFAEDYTVQKGDTYYSISKKYNITLQELYDANGIEAGAVLKVGQVLKIPGKASSEKAATTSTSKTSSTSTVKTKEYQVVSGDTLYSISKKFGTTVDNLRSLNGLDEKSVLKVGQVLKVPGTETATASTSKTTTEIKQNTNTTSNETITLEDVRTYDTNKKGNVNLVWPVKAYDVTYVTGKISGVAIETERNASVTCIKAGKVIFVGPYRGFGQVVFVQSDAGYIYVYSGLDKISVSNGEKVSFKTKLGTAGIDSLTQKSQIILMVYLNGKVQDPALVPRDK